MGGLNLTDTELIFMSCWQCNCFPECLIDMSYVNAVAALQVFQNRLML